MRSLELEDKQYQAEKEIREIQSTNFTPLALNYSSHAHSCVDDGDDSKFETLLTQLVDIISERDNIVQQVDQERIRFVHSVQCASITSITINVGNWKKMRVTMQ